MTTATFHKDTLENVGRNAETLLGYSSKYFHITRRKGGWWAVFHKPSKLRVGNLDRKTLKDTKAVVSAVETKFDWSGETIFEIAENNNLEPSDFVCAVIDAANEISFQ